MQHWMTRKTALPCLLAATLLGPLAAGAEAAAAPPTGEVATRTVKYGDLDLTRAAGAQALYTRIRSAARAVCEPSLYSPAHESLLLTRRCMEQAVMRAVADVHASALTNLYLVKTKQAITLARQP